MFIVEYYEAIKKDFKKLDKQVLIFLKQEVIPKIAYDPYQYPALQGEFQSYRKFRFTCHGVSYRIAYEIKSDRKVVLLILVSTRENFYQVLKRRIR